MIDFSGYTQKAIQKAMLEKVPKELDTREGSMIQTAVGPVAWYLEGLYMLLAQVQENAYAETAVGQALDYICAERGIYRKAAIPAVREGIFDTRIPKGSAFKTINGADSVIFLSGDPISEKEGEYIYEMTCTAAGAAGNFYTGSIMPIMAIRNLTQASIGKILVSGTEEEEDGPLRERYMATFDMAAFGGNVAAYRNAILAIEGVGAVQIYPVWNGGGTVLCSILNSQLKPADAGLVEIVQNEICPPEEGEDVPSAKGYGMAPIGAAVTVVSATGLPINITCDIQMISSSLKAENYQARIEEKIQEYLDMVCESWGKPLKTHRVEYPVSIFVSRIIAVILSISDIANVTNVTVNGSTEDLTLEETPQLQQIPILGTVIIHEV